MKLKRYEVAPLDRWVKVTDKKYRMNTLLKKQLDIMINVVSYDSDMVVLIDGEIEGTGKSTLAQQIGYYFSYMAKTKFTADNIIFSAKQLKAALPNADKFTVFVWDEAYAGANKFRVMSQDNQDIISMFQKIRQKNLFLIIVLPSFFDLSKYYAVRRSWGLVHCYLKPQLDTTDLKEGATLDFDKPVLEKGYFEYYTRPLKKKLYVNFKKDEDYDKVRGRFGGMFSPYYTVDEQAYKDKKAQIEDDEGIDEKEWIQGCLHKGMPIPSFQEYSTYARETLYQIRKKMGL